MKDEHKSSNVRIQNHSATSEALSHSTETWEYSTFVWNKYNNFNNLTTAITAFFYLKIKPRTYLEYNFDSEEKELGLQLGSERTLAIHE
jgi:hypothetical protein